MNRIDRLTAILIKLQSKRHVSAEDLSEHFGISLRTVFRDLRALGEAGVPIGHIQHKGYYVVDGYYLPPIQFTKEEAASIVMAGKFVEKQGDKMVANNFNHALLKIKSVLKNSEKDFLESLDHHMEVIKPNLPNNPAESDFFLTDIKTALVENKELTFEYFSNYNNSTTARTVEPMGLCHYSNHWHLIAYCQLRKSVRDFRTDRIMKLRIERNTFNPEVHDDYRNFIGDMFTGTTIQEAKIRFNKYVARHIADQKYYYGMVSEEVNEDGIEMTFMTSELHYFARWLVSFGDGFDIISPPELKQHLTDIINELQRHHLS